jgi:MFS family permease
VASVVSPALGPEAGVVALIGFLAMHQGLAAIAGCAWNSWMRDLVPASEYGRFFGRRTAATTALAMVLAFLGGVVVDAWKSHVPGPPAFGYSVLFGLSALIGMYGVYLLARTPDPPMGPREHYPNPFRLLAAPFRDANYRRLIVFLSSWNFAVNLAAPFFTVYMLKMLDYSMMTVMTLTIASQLSNIAFLSVWGSLSDRFSNKAVLRVAAPLFLACTLAWTFTGLEWVQPFRFPMLLVIHVLMGIATAGIALASNNIVMKLSPASNATSYLAMNSVVSASCAAVAPIIGGLCADFFATHQLTLGFTWRGGPSDVTVQVLDFHAWTFFFGMAFVAGLYSLHRLSFVQEASGVPDPLVLRDLILEARRSIHSLSSAAGLLRIVRSPFWFLRPRLAAPRRIGERLLR